MANGDEVKLTEQFHALQTAIADLPDKIADKMSTAIAAAIATSGNGRSSPTWANILALFALVGLLQITTTRSQDEQLKGMQTTLTERGLIIPPIQEALVRRAANDLHDDASDKEVVARVHRLEERAYRHDVEVSITNTEQSLKIDMMCQWMRMHHPNVAQVPMCYQTVRPGEGLRP